VREPGGPRLPGSLRHDLVIEPERLAGELDHGWADALPVLDRRREHAAHHGPALDLVGEPSLGAVRRDPREQLPDGAQQHVRLPEAGEHLADVAQEHRAGAHYQHAALGEVAVRVERGQPFTCELTVRAHTTSQFPS
jgi:hypothetical protein